MASPAALARVPRQRQCPRAAVQLRAGRRRRARDPDHGRRDRRRARRNPLHAQHHAALRARPREPGSDGVLRPDDRAVHLACGSTERRRGVGATAAARRLSARDGHDHRMPADAAPVLCLRLSLRLAAPGNPPHPLGGTCPCAQCRRRRRARDQARGDRCGRGARRYRPQRDAAQRSRYRNDGGGGTGRSSGGRDADATLPPPGLV